MSDHRRIPLVLFGSFGNWNLLIRFGSYCKTLVGLPKSATVQEKLKGLTAADAVTPNSPVVSADLYLRNC